jgi:cholesterol transport system auxiliary component
MKALVLISAFLLSACSVLPEQVPVDLYQLPAPTLQATTAGPRLSTLRIDRAISSEALSGSRLLIMTANNQFQAFPNMRLAAPVPLLWRDWLLDAFWRDGRVDGLSASSEGLQSALELGGTLRAFQVDYSGSEAQAVIQYDATLISTSGRQILASKRFEARQSLDSVEVSAAVAALGLAADRLAGELIGWVIQQGQSRPQ